MALTPEIVAAAQAAQRKYGVWASVSLAQFGVESSWGKAMPPGSNNPFGIKAAAGQPYVTCRTREVIGGQSVYINANFAKFPSFTEAFEAHAKLLATSAYYTPAMKFKWGTPGGNAEDFMRARVQDPRLGVLGMARYATDPNYIATLISTARSQHLYQYDTLPGTTTPASPSVSVPPPVPVPVANWVIFLLTNVFSGSVSTLLGTLIMLYAFVVYHHIPVAGLPLDTDWKAWLALGVFLVFGVGNLSPSPSAAQPQVVSPLPSTQLQEQPMSVDLSTLTRVINAIEAVVPILNKILADIPNIQAALPAIQADIAAIKNTLAAADQPNPQVNSQLDALLQTLNSLNTPPHA